MLSCGAERIASTHMGKFESVATLKTNIQFAGAVGFFTWFGRPLWAHYSQSSIFATRQSDFLKCCFSGGTCRIRQACRINRCKR
jgi:hypothetical protein